MLRLIPGNEQTAFQHKGGVVSVEKPRQLVDRRQFANPGVMVDHWLGIRSAPAGAYRKPVFESPESERCCKSPPADPRTKTAPRKLRSVIFPRALLAGPGQSATRTQPQRAPEEPLKRTQRRRLPVVPAPTDRRCGSLACRGRPPFPSARETEQGAGSDWRSRKIGR